MTRFSRMTPPALLASLALLSAASVLAQGTDKPANDRQPKPSFESLDKNGDGKISLSEASNDDPLFVAFKSLDTNKDGELMREEYAKYK